LGLFFYNLFLTLYAAGIRIASLFNKKARLWLAGRRGIFEKLAAWRRHIGKDEKVIWMHCASLGEFEQGRPVINALKEKYPSHKILISFFSPSGYEVQKEFKDADGVFYLPADGKKNAERFIEAVRPSLVIWVKYEYWYHYLTLLHKKDIPVLLVSAIFFENQPFFQWYGGIWKKMLRCYTAVFVQNEGSAELLQKIGIASNVVLAGDTRFDRVIAIAQDHEALPDALAEFCRGHRVIVAGSTWEEDEEELVHYVRTHREIKFIIAPHELDREQLNESKKLFGDAIFYSEFIRGNSETQVLIIDNIGMLSRLYKLADICFIGGGFTDSGIHNVPEAAVYGKPVVFGPVYQKYAEAVDLVELEGAFCVENALELEALLDKLFANDELLQLTAAITKNYIYEKKGATEKVLRYIQENRLLTS
jgi:3-deoxy-D-manno-octulosonic-acid transferase